MNQMSLDEYQRAAADTDQCSPTDPHGTMIALLGLAGEAGSLFTLYKKYLRDGDAYQIMDARVQEEVGDILWYLARIASRFGLNLQDVAEANLVKSRHRWLTSEPMTFNSLDENFTERERLPRLFRAEFREVGTPAHPHVEVYVDGLKWGSTLTDNAYSEDSYRYHDILHMAFATVLGWSPVVRALLKRKRKSKPTTDEVEDGGRAVVIEEGIAVLVFNYARQHSLLKQVKRLDWPLLRTCKEMSSHLEVSARSLNDWEEAILQGFAVWRNLQEHGGGVVICNLDTRQMRYQPLP